MRSTPAAALPAASAAALLLLAAARSSAAAAAAFSPGTAGTSISISTSTSTSLSTSLSTSRSPAFLPVARLQSQPRLSGFQLRSTLGGWDEDDEDDDAASAVPAVPAASRAASFDESTKAIRDEEDEEALARGSGMSAEEEEEYNARGAEFGSMKDRIRARAAELDIEKSVATAEAIKKAEMRAKNMAQADDPDLDMSVFEKRLLSNPEDELTDEEMAQIDPVGQMNPVQQALEELGQTKFPGPLDVAKTVGFMAVIFAISAFVILKSDEILRELYTNWGFIPAPDQKFNYDETLKLPADWNKDLNDLSGVFNAATKALGVQAPSAPVPAAPVLDVNVPDL